MADENTPLIKPQYSAAASHAALHQFNQQQLEGRLTIEISENLICEQCLL